MPILKTARPRFPISPEQVTPMFHGFAAWWNFYRANWENGYFFAGNAGGFGVANVPDEATFHRMMIEWPFAPYFDLDARPVLGVDEALALWLDAAQETPEG